MEPTGFRNNSGAYASQSYSESLSLSTSARADVPPYPKNRNHEPFLDARKDDFARGGIIMIQVECRSLIVPPQWKAWSRTEVALKVASKRCDQVLATDWMIFTRATKQYEVYSPKHINTANSRRSISCGASRTSSSVTFYD